MDDRFDIQFGSGEVFDGIGFEYVVGSYHVFGNNGTHTFDGSITTGTGASPAVLSALVAASDHLPVVADYEVVVSTPNVRITQTSGETKVIEGGLYDTYQIVLDTVPAANVSVTVTPNAQLDIGNGDRRGESFHVHAGECTHAANGCCERCERPSSARALKPRPSRTVLPARMPPTTDCRFQMSPSRFLITTRRRS